MSNKDADSDNFNPIYEFLTLISHARSVDLFLFLLLKVADAVDGGKGVVSVGSPDTHGIVLIDYFRASIDVGIQDVLAFGQETPFPVLGCIAERSIEAQIRVYVIDTLYGLGLEERIEDE